jgi:hypothetical protein
MRKLIDIKGELTVKNSVAWKLLQKASKEGKNLKNYIEEKLEEIAESKL